jgi:hypothetical protein
MRSPDVDPKWGQLSARVDALFFGLKVFMLLFVLMASFGNILTVSSIERYRELFLQTLPGKPLPGLTLMVLHILPLLASLAYLWPIIGIAAMFIRKRVTLALLLFSGALFCAVLQSTLVILAMQLPLQSVMGGANP